mgnify:CR=1 FL=1
MWTADKWKDYEVLDTSCGEKLERWGKYLLIRPDPQVIWNTPKINSGWQKKNGHYHRSSKGGEANKFKTFTGLLEARIRGENQSQLAACSGKSPVCLKLKGFNRKVSS